MKIGLPIGGSMPTATIIDMIRFADSMGIDYLTTNNRMVPFDRDPFVRLALVAEHAERATMGAWSINPFLYHPVAVARAMAQIDEMAPGRTVLGWVPGSPIGLASAGRGEPRMKPMKALREAVELSKLLLSGHVPPGAIADEESRREEINESFRLNYEGEHFPFTNNLVLPSRKVPVMTSGLGPKVHELGGEIADEVLTGWFANEGGNDWALERIATGAARGGRTLADIKIHRGIHLAVWPDREVAYQTLVPITAISLILSAPFRKNFGIKLPFEKEVGDVSDPTSDAFRYAFSKGISAYSGSPALGKEIPIETHLQMAVAGTPDDCIEQLNRTVLDERFDVLHLALFVPPPEAENWPKAVELLMKEIVPGLKIPSKAR